VVAERVGRDRSYITNYLRLLRLPEDLQELLQVSRLSTGHARTLLGVEDVNAQRRIARKIIDQDLSVRATERLVRLMSQAGRQPSKESRKPQAGDANVRAAESKLRRHFGTHVRIVQSKGVDSGKIELEFYNQGDLDRLYKLLIQTSA